jgi:hypothetical protein
VQLGLVHVLVFGKFGIAVGLTEDCKKLRRCQVNFKTTKNMTPKAKIVVYHIKNFNKKVQTGSTEIFFDEFSKNKVSSFDLWKSLTV